MSRPAGRAGTGQALIVLAIPLAAAAFVPRSALMGELRQETRRQSISAVELGSRQMQRILTAQQALRSRPHATREIPRRYEARPLEPSFSTEPLAYEELAGALGIGIEWLHRGVPVVALQLDPDDLAELRARPGGRGPDWERPAHFAYVENGEVRLAGMVAVRIHGGAGRRRNRYGYRVYFRRRQGLDHLPAEIFPTGGRLPARTVILRRDSGRGRHDIEWTFVGAVGNEIGRRIGLPVTPSQPVVLFINGRPHYVRALVERIDERFLESHFGHRDFTLVRTKFGMREEGSPVTLGDADRFRSLNAWAKAERPLTIDEAERRVDLDNFMRWSLLVQILGTGDNLQGPLLLDHRAENPRWFTMPWDLDISLGIWGDELAEVNRLGVFGSKARFRDVRNSVLARLLDSSEVFRRRFAALYDEIDNHILTRRARQELLEPYFAEATRFALDPRFLVTMRRFLRQRPAIVRRQLGDVLDVASHLVTVRVPPGGVAKIDGYPYTGDYTGTYFEGSEVTLDASIDGRSRGWRIDGAVVGGPRLTLPVVGSVEIELDEG